MSKITTKTILLAFLLALGALSPAPASLDVQGATIAQQSLVTELYWKDIPVKFRRDQPVRIRFLADGAMNASIQQNDTRESDDDRASIDGIYQDGPPRISLRASRPPAEVRQVFTHEYGHFVWSSVLSANQRDVFRRIYAVSRDEHHLVSDYAEASPEEGFAETFSFFVLHARQLADLDPQAYALLSALAAPAHDDSHAPADHGREWEEQVPAQ